jgi:hypothetical protein
MNTQELFNTDDERLGLPSASGLERLMLCPGSKRMERGMPESTNPDAERGTRIHAWLAGETIDLDSEEEIDAFACRDQAAPLIEGARTIIREERIYLRDGLRPIFSGQADVIALFDADTRAVVLDYKTGRGSVSDADTNAQLAALAVLVRCEFPTVETASVAIIQPVLRAKPIVATYDTAGMDAAERTLRAALAEASKENARLNPGESQCKYCKGKTVCPALSGQTIGESRDVALHLDITETEAATKELRATIEDHTANLPSDRLAYLAERLPLAKLLFDAVENEIFERLCKDPESVEGFAIVIDKPRVSDAEELWKRWWMNSQGLTNPETGRAKPGAGKKATAEWKILSVPLILTRSYERQSWRDNSVALNVLKSDLSPEQLRRVAGKVVPISALTAEADAAPAPQEGGDQ